MRHSNLSLLDYYLCLKKLQLKFACTWRINMWSTWDVQVMKITQQSHGSVCVCVRRERSLIDDHCTMILTGGKISFLLQLLSQIWSLIVGNADINATYVDTRRLAKSIIWIFMSSHLYGQMIIKTCCETFRATVILDIF